MGSGGSRQLIEEHHQRGLRIDRSNGCQLVVQEGGIDDGGLKAGFPYCLDRLVSNATHLEFQHQSCFSRRNVEHLFQRWNPFTVSRVKGPDLRQRQGINSTFSVGCSIDGRIVQSDEGAVRRTAHIDFHEICSELDPSLNRGQCVFRSMSGSTTMADSQHTMHGISETNAEEAGACAMASAYGWRKSKILRIQIGEVVLHSLLLMSLDEFDHLGINFQQSQAGRDLVGTDDKEIHSRQLGSSLCLLETVVDVAFIQSKKII